MSVSIKSQPLCSDLQAASWASFKGAPFWFAALAEPYWAIGKVLNIRPDGAFAQACKETNFGTFLRPDGTPSPAVSKANNNYCGLKTKVGGGNDDPNAHASFSDPIVGILAHFHHLDLYTGFYHVDSVDPRHFMWLKGRAETFEALNNNWAGPGYGTSIENDYLAKMLGFSSYRGA